MKACVFLMWILWGVGLAVAQEFVPEIYPVCSIKLYRLMYDGQKFCAYSVGNDGEGLFPGQSIFGEPFRVDDIPGLRDLTLSTNGVDWVSADQPPTGVITLNHNGQGVLYALVASSIMDDSYCKVSLQSTNDGSIWADHGEVCRMQTEGLYSLQGEISALGSKVMIRVNRGDVILYDASASLFSTISFPRDAIDQLFFSGACMYVITDPYADAASSSESYDVIPGDYYDSGKLDGLYCSSDDGQSWKLKGWLSPLYSWRIYDEYGGQFITSEHVMNQFGECPAYQHPGFALPGTDWDISYNGKHGVVANDDIHYSTDHLSSWSTLELEGVHAISVDRNDSRFVVLAHQGSNTVAVSLSSTAVEYLDQDIVPVAASIATELQGSNTVKKIVFSIKGTVLHRLEMSSDMQDWQPYALPFSGGVAPEFCLSNSYAERLFFRAKEIAEP